MRRHISCLIILSFARRRSGRVFLLIWNLPWRVLPQMKVKPRKLKVSGLPSPRRWRRSAAKRPNSMSRVFSGGSVSANYCNRSRIASRKWRASLACWQKPVRDSEELFLVDRVQQRDHRPLDDLVLQGRDRERALPAVRLGYVDPPRRQCPIRSPLDPVVQVLELALEVCFVVRPRQSIHTRRCVLLEFEERLFE